MAKPKTTGLEAKEEEEEEAGAATRSDPTMDLTNG